MLATLARVFSTHFSMLAVFFQTERTGDLVAACTRFTRRHASHARCPLTPVTHLICLRPPKSSDPTPPNSQTNLPHMLQVFARCWSPLFLDSTSFLLPPDRLTEAISTLCPLCKPSSPFPPFAQTSPPKTITTPQTSQNLSSDARLISLSQRIFFFHDLRALLFAHT